jgi:hypothetical protein
MKDEKFFLKNVRFEHLPRLHNGDNQPIFLEGGNSMNELQSTGGVTVRDPIGEKHSPAVMRMKKIGSRGLRHPLRRPGGADHENEKQ